VCARACGRAEVKQYTSSAVGKVSEATQTGIYIYIYIYM